MKRQTRDQRIVLVLKKNARTTLQDLADEFEMTRERIRQIGNKAGVDNQIRLQERAQLKKKEYEFERNKRETLWKKGFRTTSSLVRSWLREIGYNYCHMCNAAKPIPEFGVSPVRCLECNTFGVRNRYRTKNGMPLLVRDIPRRPIA